MTPLGARQQGMVEHVVCIKGGLTCGFICLITRLRSPGPRAAFEMRPVTVVAVAT